MASIAGGRDNRDECDTKKWLQEVLGDVSKSSAAKQLALGTASGWVTGFLTMKVGKFVAVAVGGTIIVLQVANHKGYIKIDWDRIQKQADKVADKIEKETTGRGPGVMDKILVGARENQWVAAGFLAGLFLGFASS